VKARRLARRLALDVLYEAEIRDQLPVDALETHRREGWVRALPDEEGRREWPSEEVLAYAERLVKGVQTHQADIDSVIASYADRWAIERMPVVDRSLLRIGLFELLWGDDVPVAVAINEAVELAKTLSTDDSGRFINGLLGHVVEDRRAGPPRDGR
jgi:N utilization substance protein B